MYNCITLNFDITELEAKVEVESDLNLDKDDKHTLSNMRYLTRLMSDMTKYTILVVCAILSTFVIALYLIVTFEIVDIRMNNTSQIAVMNVLCCIDNCINCLCLYLQYKFSIKYYKKICHGCHRRCEDRYTRTVNSLASQDGDAQITPQLSRLNSGQIGFDETQTRNITLN